MLVGAKRVVVLGRVIDVIAPVLSNPTDVVATSTTATLTVDTDEGSGTLYAVVTTSSTAPSKARIKLGQDSSGVAAAYAGSQAVSGIGTKTFNATGLAAATEYYTFFMQEDAAGNQSNVAAADGFVTNYAAETLTIGPTTPVNGTGGIHGTVWLTNAGRPCPRSGNMTAAQIYSTANGDVKIKQYRRSGTVYTFVDERTVTVNNAGLNSVAVSPALPVLAGDVFGVYSATSNTLKFNAVSSPSGTEYYSVAGNNTSTITVGATTLPSLTERFEVNYTISVPEAAASRSVGNVYYLGCKTPAAGSGNAGTATSYIEDHLCPVDSRLETIEAYSSAISLAVIHILGPTAAGLTLQRSFTISLAVGSNSLVAGTHFPRDVVVPTGGMLQIWSLKAGLTVDNSVPRYYRTLDGASPGGIWPTTTLAQGGILSAATSLGLQIRYGFRKTAAIATSTTKLDQTFTILPLDFTVAGWGITSGKARNTGTGLANRVAWRRGTYGNGKVSVWVTFSGATDEIAVFRNPFAAGDNLGTIFTLKVDTGRLAFRDLWTGGNTLGAVTVSKTSTITFTTGVEYQIDLEKVGCTLTATVHDGATTDTLSFDAHNGTTAYNLASGLAIGSPGFAAIAGTIDVSRMLFTSTAAPSLIAYGDSITESSGATLDTTGYAYLIMAALATPGNGLVSAISGCGSGNILNRIEWELRQFYPRDVLVLIGTNDTVTATWQANMTEIINRIEACGSNAWIGAVPAEAADSNPELVMNPWLRSNHASKVISFDYALTTGGTGLGANRNASLYADTLHPNDAGCVVMKARAQADAPSIFS